MESQPLPKREPSDWDLRELPERFAARGRACRYLEKTGSTNDDARSWADQEQGRAPDGAVIVANAQTQGRGRSGRSWATAVGESLAMSVVLRPNVPAERLPLLSLVVGLAVRDAIAPFVHEVMVKWPNDIVVARGNQLRKLGGILLEATFRGSNMSAVVAGIGVNVFQTSFTEPLVHLATSLTSERARSTAVSADTDRFELNRGHLALAIAANIDLGIDDLEHNPREIIQRLNQYDALLGRIVEHDGSVGLADGIAEDGRLRVKMAAGIRFAQAGEVRISP